ncbi:MAG: hypothetical protein H6733_04985 [Alphaproteobacteria bacterium]|nr:hypothetical protein [Alphaproteobacteria bacterium]
MDAAALLLLAALALGVAVGVRHLGWMRGRLVTLRSLADTLHDEVGSLKVRVQLVRDPRLPRTTVWRGLLPVLGVATLGPALAQGSWLALTAVVVVVAFAAGAVLAVDRTSAMALSVALPIREPPTVRAAAADDPTRTTTADAAFDAAVHVDGDPLVALSRLRPAVRSALLRLVADAGEVRDGAVAIVRPADAPTSAEALVHAVRTARLLVKADAIGADPTARVLALALDDPDPVVRHHALSVLVPRLGAPQDAVSTVLARNHVDPDEPDAIAKALQGGPEVRLAAAVRLAEIGGRDQLSALMAVRRTDPVEPFASDAIAAIRARQVGPDGRDGG